MQVVIYCPTLSLLKHPVNKKSKSMTLYLAMNNKSTSDWISRVASFSVGHWLFDKRLNLKGRIFEYPSSDTQHVTPFPV